ncbi:MAG: hypothetical protein H0V27_14965 [Pyrinomonadaceae bacterium]|jgi:predicted alpha/beta-fold hydrolase|nr:hypothetical protein [Pyrinomonadaceae bacterium]
MLTNWTRETAKRRQATAAAMMWQPCVVVSGVRAFNRSGSSSLYPLTAGNRLQEQDGAIKGSAIKDRHSRQV